ncbi:MAG: hypothetical protein GKS06_20635 [Acidobacteria bacterium]|nr:hypothetical protein [Acidobacteriota bacterium]
MSRDLFDRKTKATAGGILAARKRFVNDEAFLYNFVDYLTIALDGPFCLEAWTGQHSRPRLLSGSPCAGESSRRVDWGRPKSPTELRLAVRPLASTSQNRLDDLADLLEDVHGEVLRRDVELGALSIETVVEQLDRDDYVTPRVRLAEGTPIPETADDSALLRVVRERLSRVLDGYGRAQARLSVPSPASGRAAGFHTFVPFLHYGGRDGRRLRILFTRGQRKYLGALWRVMDDRDQLPPGLKAAAGVGLDTCANPLADLLEAPLAAPSRGLRDSVERGFASWSSSHTHGFPGFTDDRLNDFAAQLLTTLGALATGERMAGFDSVRLFIVPVVAGGVPWISLAKIFFVSDAPTRQGTWDDSAYQLYRDVYPRLFEQLRLGAQLDYGESLLASFEDHQGPGARSWRGLDQAWQEAARVYPLSQAKLESASERETADGYFYLSSTRAGRLRMSLDGIRNEHLSNSRLIASDSTESFGPIDPPTWRRVFFDRLSALQETLDWRRAHETYSLTHPLKHRTGHSVRKIRQLADIIEGDTEGRYPESLRDLARESLWHAKDVRDLAEMTYDIYFALRNGVAGYLSATSTGRALRFAETGTLDLIPLIQESARQANESPEAAGEAIQITPAGISAEIEAFHCDGKRRTRPPEKVYRELLFELLSNALEHGVPDEEAIVEVKVDFTSLDGVPALTFSNQHDEFDLTRILGNVEEGIWLEAQTIPRLGTGLSVVSMLSSATGAGELRLQVNATEFRVACLLSGLNTERDDE